MYGCARMTERRQRPRPATHIEYLQQLPALTLLNRLTTPMIAVGPDGILIYVNSAGVKMLGHPDTSTLIGQPLPALLVGHAHETPDNCLRILRAAGNAFVEWYDADGLVIRTVVSEPLLLRADDPVLLITITDVTELVWNTAH